MQTEPLKYNASTDTFEIGNQRLLRVTKILTEVLGDPYCGIPGETLDKASKRGTAVHQIVQYMNQGKIINWGSVDKEDRDILEPYAMAYQEFRRDYKNTVTGTEIRLHSPEWGFTGQIDIEAVNPKSELEIIDIKTLKTPDKRVIAQLGGYKHLWERNNRPRKVKRAFALYLWPHKSPGYKLVEVEDLAFAERWFLAMVTVAQGKRKVGMKLDLPVE